MKNPIAKFMNKANNYDCFHEERRDKILIELTEKEGEEALLTYLDCCDDEDKCLNDVGCSNLTVED